MNINASVECPRDDVDKNLRVQVSAQAGASDPSSFDPEAVAESAGSLIGHAKVLADLFDEDSFVCASINLHVPDPDLEEFDPLIFTVTVSEVDPAVVEQRRQSEEALAQAEVSPDIPNEPAEVDLGGEKEPENG